MEEILKNLEQNTKRVLEGLKAELAGVRTNRPHPGLVEDIKVDYMGQPLTIKQLGSISIAPPREIDISIWDHTSVAAVAKAIEQSGRGLTANVDGNIIRINLPQLTDERRKELTKLIKSLVEETKIKVRSLRDEVNKKIESSLKEKKITEDQKFKSREKVQKSVDSTNEAIENLLSGKIKEMND